jgi:hypothetical protein
MINSCLLAYCFFCAAGYCASVEKITVSPCPFDMLSAGCLEYTFVTCSWESTVENEGIFVNILNYNIRPKRHCELTLQGKEKKKKRKHKNTDNDMP